MDEKIKSQIEELVKSEPLNGRWSKKPLTSEQVQAMEEKLGFTFPEEYREFLQVYGWLEPGWGEPVLGKAPAMDTHPDWVIEGFQKWSVAGRTISLRKGYPTFPKNCAAIQFDGGDGWYCIVCEGKDRGKVIYWDSFCDPKQAYPNIPTEEWFEENLDWDRGDSEKDIPSHPNSKKKDFWAEGLDFWSWLLRLLRGLKKQKERSLKKEAKEGPREWARRK